jgi:hypothetical protein
LLLEEEIRGDHGSHATGAAQRGGHDGAVEQGEQEVPHARVSVEQRLPPHNVAQSGNQREN